MDNTQKERHDERSIKHVPALHIVALTLLILAFLGISQGVFAQGSTQQHSDSAQTVKQDAQELMNSIEAYTSEQRDEAVEQVQQSLAILDRRIERMQASVEDNWEVMTLESQQMTRAAIDELREQRAALDTQLTRLSNSSAEAWTEVKAGFVDAYENMADAWEAAEQSLTESS